MRTTTLPPVGEQHPLWICTDCLVLVANGDTPPELDERATKAYLGRVRWFERLGRVTTGRALGQDGCECTDWDTDEHRNGCEFETFSHSRCDLCRRPNSAGERHAATWTATATFDVPLPRDVTHHLRCRKCGMFPSEHVPSGFCTSPFDPFHTTGVADYVRIEGAPDRTVLADDFARRYVP